VIFFSNKKLLLLIVLNLASPLLHCYSILFVHLGKQLPTYLTDALVQARLFNATTDIYLLANKCALDAAQLPTEWNIKGVPVEQITKTKHHQTFLKNSVLDKAGRDGFWFFASERFLYIDDFMRQYNVADVFHLESDNMLYVDLAELLPIFHAHYPGIAATFDNDARCIPGFIYFANKKAMTKLARFFVEQAKSNQNDMVMIGLFKNKYGLKYIDQLPIVMSAYAQKMGLRSPSNHLTTHAYAYSNHIGEFNSIFDAAALGQYLGGIDPRNGKSEPGFINESCLFNPACLSYEWVVDAQGRKVPFAFYDGVYYRINNLHIHSKYLYKFLSK